MGVVVLKHIQRTLRLNCIYPLSAGELELLSILTMFGGLDTLLWSMGFSPRAGV